MSIINKKYLAKYSVCPIPENFDYDELMNYVDIASVIWIIPLIGREWYDELEEQVENNTVTQENAAALTEAIWPLLGFAVVYEALPMIAYHVSSVGWTKGHSENSDSLTLKELTLVQDHIKRQLQARGDFAKKWICEHQEYYPLADFCACECSCCNDNQKLYKPKSFQQLYSPKRKCTDLK